MVNHTVSTARVAAPHGQSNDLDKRVTVVGQPRGTAAIGSARPAARGRVGSEAAAVRRRSSIARPSHRMCVVSQRLCVRGLLPSQIMCAGKDALLCVWPFIIVRRYTYADCLDSILRNGWHETCPGDTFV